MDANGMINTAWRSYAEQVVPATAGDIKITETRRAFYACAAAVTGLVTAMHDQTNGCAVELFTEICNEVNAFKDRMGKDF